jgi:hypothetical protein
LNSIAKAGPVKSSWEKYKKYIIEGDGKNLWEIIGEDPKRSFSKLFDEWRREFTDLAQKHSNAVYSKFEKTNSELAELSDFDLFCLYIPRHDSDDYAISLVNSWEYIEDRSDNNEITVLFRARKNRRYLMRFQLVEGEWKVKQMHRRIWDPVTREVIENGAISNLRAICTAQEMFKMTAAVDVNENGIGEYALLRELVGDITSRDGNFLKSSGTLPNELGETGECGVSVVNGYCYTIFLPLGNKLATNKIDKSIYPPLSEKHYIAYAWPESDGLTGKSAFIIDNNQRVLRIDDSPWKGRLNPPHWAVALKNKGNIGWGDAINDQWKKVR